MSEYRLKELVETAKNDCRNIEWSDSTWADGLVFSHLLDGRQASFAVVYWNPSTGWWDVYTADDADNEQLIRDKCNHFQTINEVRKIQAELFGWEDAYGKPVIEVSDGYARREYGHCYRIPQVA